MDAREIEPIRNYNFITGAEDDDLTLEIPGYFKGEALVRELYYNGGEHGIFVRNKHQLLLCDYIHPEVRELLKEAYDIFISEPDSGREYMAAVVHEDIDALAEEAEELHDYRFPCHPFPIQDGTLSIGEARCDICDERRGIYYSKMVDKEDGSGKIKNVLCPQCIEEYQLHLFHALDRQYRWINGKKMFYKGNLPFIDRGKDCSFWGIHCDEPAVYLGKMEPEDLTPFLDRELRANWNWQPNRWADKDPSDVLGQFDRGELDAHLFKCKECGAKFAGFS